MKCEKAIWTIVLAVIFSMLLSIWAHSQDAKVIQLTSEDAIAAKATYDEMKSAEKKWADIQTKLQKTYKGFDGGIEFSSDFKFIVPKQMGITTYTWPNYCTVQPASGFTFSSTSTCGNCVAFGTMSTIQ